MAGTNYPLRVEAASYRGKPVFFRLIGDWVKPDRMATNDDPLRKRVGQVIEALVVLLLLTGSVVLARRNYVLGKSDMRGVFRLGVAVFILQMVLWACKAHFVTSIGLIGLIILAISSSLFLSTLVCVIYTAIEPFVRRHWPHAIISWTRLMAGKMRDPHVGRDVLYGILLGIVWSINYEVLFFLVKRQGGEPSFCDEVFLQGTRAILGASLWHLANSIQAMLILFLVMFAFRALLRKPWLAAIVFVVFWVGTKVLTQSATFFYANLTLQFLIYAIAAFVILRFGFISLAMGMFSADFLLNIPVTTHLSAWYSSSTIFALITVIALAAWGAYTALGGQKLWRTQAFD